jgi:hypothetical protein
MAEGDDRWRLFTPFELVWAGGHAGRLVGQVLAGWRRGNAAFSAKVSRYHERTERRDRERQARVAASREAARLENQRRIAQARAGEAQARGAETRAAAAETQRRAAQAESLSRESEPVSDDRA